ncbi:Ppx/GppA phosphatase family protein [Corynebacterium sp. HS2168-gen11]|uniref:Ppx/GppA phosphatase family protein n=1 Tax=Corynebacterium sp. HS2168-gen11 TaxID=2974027 RepID=UPI00216B5AD4|nr:Ppx/GppA phosphatase family protein [Corynebacterium sp. HS2168-gen11]MCS4534986.1 Ppx/GppA family phosphatase [Corynebacterium sp. HS2168-gen11]
MSRYAAIDCGTNSLRLLIVEVIDGRLHELERRMEVVRLGQSVDATGMFDPAALQRCQQVLRNYVDRMHELDVRRVRMVATSATRDAANRDEFFQLTADLLGEIEAGVQAEVISGEEEAQLSFLGASLDLPDTTDEVCVIDLGGGSTEFIVGKRSGEIAGAYSTQMGCVRVTERFLQHDPPLPAEISAVQHYVAQQIELAQQHVPLCAARTVVGCAGTFTTFAALALQLAEYDPTEIHNARISVAQLRELALAQIRLTEAQRGAQPVMHPGRADVFAGGALVVLGILDALEQCGPLESIVISEKDILDGIIACLIADK